MKNKIYYNLTDLQFRKNGAITEVITNDGFALTNFVYHDDLMSWLEEETQPMLTDTEKAILKSIDTDTLFEWIARTDDMLWVDVKEPMIESYSGKLVSFDLENENLAPLSHLFCFIENNTYYNIKELL